MVSNFFFYLLKVSLIFTFIYGVYFVFLRKLSFHSANRTILLSAIVASLIIPLLSFDIFHSQSLNYPIPDFDNFVAEGVNIQTGIEKVNYKAGESSIFYVLLVLYLAGICFVSFKLVRSFVMLILLKRKSEIVKTQKIDYVFVNEKNAFSFGRSIYVNKDNFDFKSPVIEHEKAHISLHHSFDLIFTELFIILLWFNPFVYFFRKSLKQIHEFQADENVLKNGVKKSVYLELLLNSFMNNNLVETFNYFNGLTLKKRFEMITNKKSSKYKIFKFLVIVPVLAVSLLLFSANRSEQIFSGSVANIGIIDTGDKIPAIFPFREGEYKKISSGYGERMNPYTKKMQFHNAIDIIADEGVDILATADGIITFAEEKGNYGNLVVIKHDNSYETYYAHLKDFSVKSGDRVVAGQVIGHVGNTGLSTAPHLHYEVRKDGKPQNPELYY